MEQDFNTVADGQFYQQPAFGAAIDASNPDRLVQVSDWVYYTINGGKDWKCGHARRAGGSRTSATWSMQRPGGDDRLELLHRSL